MEKIRVLIVEDNKEMQEILKNFFDMTEDLVYCGSAYDGEEALVRMRELLPDIVLLDIIMPKLDGISVLENLRENPLEKMPCIIVTSALGQEKITGKAIQLGAEYYIMKPYNLSELHRRIQFIYKKEEVLTENYSLKNPALERLDSIIIRNVMELGVPTNILGFKYIAEAVKILITEENVYPISKQVYAPLAQKNNTTMECVESALRKTINRIYQLNNESIKKLLTEEKRPSNGKLLTMLAQKIKLESSDIYE